MINSFRSVYGSEKSLFALMSNPDFHHLYTPEELKVIKAHVPWTRTLSETETLLPSGKKVTLEQFITEHRTKLVMKPSKGYGGEGVVIGLETEQQEWGKKFWQGNRVIKSGWCKNMCRFRPSSCRRKAKIG